MTKSINEIILKFETEDVSKSSLMPLMAHAVLNNVSAKKIKDFLEHEEYKISLKSLQRWRREAAEWLGLSFKKSGRPKQSEINKRHEIWHKIHGYPTLEMLVNGWQPERKFKVKPKVEKVQKIAAEPTPKIAPKSTAETGKKPSKKTDDKFAETPPIIAGESNENPDDFFKSMIKST